MPKEQPDRRRLNIVSSSAFFEINRQSLRVYYGQNLTFYPHFHPGLELFYCLQGQTKVVVEDKEKILQPGEMAVAWPNHVHSYTAIGETRHIIAIVDLNQIHEYAALITQHSCLDFFLGKEDVHPDILHCMDTLARNGNMGEQLRRAYVGVMAGRLLMQLPLEEKKRPLAHDSLRDLITYIDAHIAEPISLQMLSKELYLNKYYISKLFSQRIGCSLRTYVNAIRIDRACSMLADPDAGIPAIVEACGFESERTFYRAFRAQRGVTPKAFREQASHARQ